MLAQTTTTKLLGLVFEYECPSGRQLRDKVVVTEVKRNGLPPDRWAGLEVVNDLEMIGRPGQGSQRCIADAHLNRLLDDQRIERRILLGHAGIVKHIDEWFARSITAGHLP